MKPLVVATATDTTLPRTYSGSRQKVVAHDIGSAPDRARIAGLRHAARFDFQLRVEWRPSWWAVYTKWSW
jgi:hypothetical protein